MYSIIDIETTGGKYDEEGITEIAIISHDGNKVIDQFISLVNPEIEIQPYVKNLTGISSKMLKNSPKFHEIAKRIIEITNKCVIVAHNVNFDYRILKTEFRRLGYIYERQTLCTINLAKVLLPDMKSYSLGKLVKSLGIPISNQHRAFGDAKATVKLFKLLLEKDSKKEILKGQMNNSNLNKISNKHLTIIDKIPSEIGVYYFYDHKNKIIFIGNSKNIKKKILAHLISKSRKALELIKNTNNISFSLTGNEQIALLKSINEIEINKPLFNDVKKNNIIGLYIKKIDGINNLYFENTKNDKKYLANFKTKKNVLNQLYNWYTKNFFFLDKVFFNNLKLNSIPDSIKSPYSLSKIDHNKSVDEIIKSFKYTFNDFLILGKGRSLDEFSFIFIKNSSLKGYGFFELNYQIKNEKQIKNRLVKMKETIELKKIITKFILNKKFIKLLPLNQVLEIQKNY
jgi:DNA polymerase-3 subunit epsilon